MVYLMKNSNIKIEMGKIMKKKHNYIMTLKIEDLTTMLSR